MILVYLKLNALGLRKNLSKKKINNVVLSLFNITIQDFICGLLLYFGEIQEYFI